MKVLLFFALVFFAGDATGDTDLRPGHHQFSANVYKELQKSQSGNFMVSPLSVEIALALAREGAKGETANQLSKGLNVDETVQGKDIYHELIPTNRQMYNLTSVNKLYIGKQFEIAAAFKEIAENVFEAEVENVDFSDAHEAAENINKWVEQKTNDKIKKLVDEQDVHSDIALILINTLYFEGTWLNQFPTAYTGPLPFHVDETNEVSTTMLKQTGTFEYHESSELNAKILRMWYNSSSLRMTIVLPNEISGLSDLENKIDNIFPRASQALKFEKVDVTIPKFTLETSIEFKPILQALGIVDPFEMEADFSGIGAQGNGLKIDKVAQKTFIEVNEAGTIAGAATNIDFGLKNAPTQPKLFTADHPFIYYLSCHYGSILFAGRFMKPLEQE